MKMEHTQLQLEQALRQSSKMDDLAFISEMMEYRYSADPYPVYLDYKKSKNKINYLSLAKIIFKNKTKGLYK